MKKTYIIPAMNAEKASVSNMIAVSLAIDETTADDAFVKEAGDWSIWNDEE